MQKKTAEELHNMQLNGGFSGEKFIQCIFYNTNNKTSEKRWCSRNFPLKMFHFNCCLFIFLKVFLRNFHDLRCIEILVFMRSKDVLNHSNDALVEIQYKNTLKCLPNDLKMMEKNVRFWKIIKIPIWKNSLRPIWISKKTYEFYWQKHTCIKVAKPFIVVCFTIFFLVQLTPLKIGNKTHTSHLTKCSQVHSTKLRISNIF